MRFSTFSPERAGLGEVLVEAEGPGDRPRDLRHFQRVRQARAVVIAFERDEDLRLVLQPPERTRVNDAVAVALVLRAVVVGLSLFRHRIPPEGAGRARGEDREPLLL